jgi:hypothetical protein
MCDAPLPPIELTLTPEWFEVCNKLGYDPYEWKSYGAGTKRPDHRSRLEAMARDEAARKAALDRATRWLVMLMRHNPQALVDALGLTHVRDGDRTSGR